MTRVIKSGRAAVVAFLVASQSASASTDPTTACMEALGSEARFTPIKSKMNIGGSAQPTFDALTNTSTATEDERPLIAAFATGFEDCYRQGEKWRVENYRPDALPAFSFLRDSWLNVVAELYLGQINYATYARRRTEIAQEFMSRAQTISRAAAQEREARDTAAKAQALAQAQQAQMLQAQEEAERRQMLLQWMLSGRAFRPIEPMRVQPLPPTVQTTCTRVGAQTYCSTR